MTKKGRLIVIEGIDGSGKSTQFARLCQHTDEEGLAYQQLVFPQYKEESSALIRMYLAGEFGDQPGDVNPYAASSFYAVDRYASWKKVWQDWYMSGGLVLSDRYTTSNAVHQSSKLPKQERDDYFQWLADYEYQRLGLPSPDLVFYLDLPTDKAIESLRKREAETNTKGDLHERNSAYLATCREAALDAARFYGWEVIPCVDATGAHRSVESIHKDIWERARLWLH